MCVREKQEEEADGRGVTDACERGLLLRWSPGGEPGTPPPPRRSQRARAAWPQCFWERRELGLAGFHLLSHVGGEVISERGEDAVGGLEEMERFGTAAVGKATGNPQEPNTRRPG